MGAKLAIGAESIANVYERASTFWMLIVFAMSDLSPGGACVFLNDVSLIFCRIGCQ
jgi:hypothetical protein